MKRLLILLAILALAGLTQAQEKGEIGLGIGSINNSYYYSASYKNRIYYGRGVGAGMRLGYEQPFKQLPTGYLSLGGILVLGQSDRDNYDNTWKSRYRWRHTVIAGRVTYTLPVTNELSFYGGVNLGIHFEKFTEIYKTDPPVGYVVKEYNYASPYAGLYFGTNYKVSSKIALFGELGYDLMWFTVGAKLYL